jgi:hypothetical protein
MYLGIAALKAATRITELPIAFMHVMFALNRNNPASLAQLLLLLPLLHVGLC